jgi:ATP-dependent DNA helicase RecQ
VLFYRPENVGLRKFQAGSGKLDPRHIEQVAEIVRREEGPADPREIASRLDISPRKVASILNRLDEVGAEASLTNGDASGAARLAAEAHERKKQTQRERIEDMQRYADLATCRREYLLRYFGDEFSGPCGNCDNDGPVDVTAGTRREVA